MSIEKWPRSAGRGWPQQAPLAAVTAFLLLMVAAGCSATSAPFAAGAESRTSPLATATSAASQQPAATLPQPSFEIAPEVGLPGTAITVAGQGWAPDDAVALRLQDPANPYTQPALFVLASADSNGSFRANFTLPTASPWSGLPAILIWAVSQKTGIQAAQPEPFVVLAAPMQSAAAVAGQQPAAGTASPTPAPTTAGATPTVLATATPNLAATATAAAAVSAATASAAAFESNLPTPTAQPSPTPLPAYQSPLPTPTTEPTATPLLAFQSPPPAATPGVLPHSGSSVLETATVRVANAALRAGPGAGYNLKATLTAGQLLGVIGEDRAKGWLLVTTSNGAIGWIQRGETDSTGG